MSWRGLIMVFLLLGALASGWALWSQRNKDRGTPADRGRPDYVLNDFRVVVLDKQGKESFTLAAPKLVRDPSVKTMDIDTPTFSIPAKDGSGGPWSVRSSTAWVSPKADEVRLRGAVKADSTNAEGRPITITTEQLNVFPDANKATSDVPVTLVQPGTIMNGSGLQADLETKNVNIPNVKVRYEAKAR